MSEHKATGFGTVKSIGSFDVENGEHMRMDRVAQKIEEHGEVHATFEGVEGEVELRLGTTLVDYSTGSFEVWDGDGYQTFPASNLVRARKPMDVTH